MIGTRITTFRKQKKMSQNELGVLTNLDQTLISRIERGQRKVTADEITLFAKALGVSVAELLDEEEQTA
ncbi:helix-turn-helix domain-containing protein [Aneurinibacillus aneurinilyticus]|uniref:helix-turn-helix domain-containing protein n=1 Tax=Aneurinibacillus aneurinilyticus TaxID=1391 RepID=UPI003670336D